MSEETNVQDHNDGTWSGIKKTIVGTLGTLVLGGGTWLGSHLFGGGSDKAESAPAQTAAPNIIINNSQQQQAAPATKTIVVEKSAPTAAPAKPAEPAPKKKEFSEEPKW